MVLDSCLDVGEVACSMGKIMNRFGLIPMGLALHPIKANRFLAALLSIINKL